MHSGYGSSEIHHHQQKQQHLIDDDGDCCGPSVFTNSNHQNNHHLYHHSQQQQLFQQPPPPPPPSYPFLTFHQPLQQQQQQLGLEVQNPCPTSHPFFDVNFKLVLDQNSGSNRDEQRQLHHHQSLVIPPLHCLHSSQEDSYAIKLQHQHLWCNSNSNVDKEGEPEIEIECNKNCKNLNSTHLMGNKYKQFGGELEAIYSLTNAKINVENNNEKTGSGSGIIGFDLDHGSEYFIGEEATLLLEKVHEKKKRKRKMKEKLSSMVGFFEELVKQVMDHQEGLHRRFLEVIQRMDREKCERDEAWRREETAKNNREAIVRAHEQAIASSREAKIISHIEKITGQSINLPPRRTNLSLQQSDQVKNSCRWPKAEVQALIQVREFLESRFLEPGLKAPLWEEVSALMASMGYQRSAKRCKEKWENINKYFRKTKESGKKRSTQSKTCPYFDQLDQLYSNNSINLPSNPDMGLLNQGYSVFLEALGAARDTGIADETVEFEQGRFGNEKQNQEDEDKVDGAGEKGD